MTDKTKTWLLGIITVVLAGVLASCALFYPAGLYRDVEAQTSAILGTPVITSVPSSSDYSFGFGYPIVYRGEIYFAGTNTSGEPKVYKISKTDGTIYEGIPSYYGTNFSYPIVYNDILYFQGYSNSTSVMMRYDGNTASYVPVTFPYQYGFSDPIVFNNLLFFQGYDQSAIGYRAFSFDGATVGWINQEDSYSNNFYYPAIHPSGNWLYFAGYDTSMMSDIYYFDTSDNSIHSTYSGLYYYYAPIPYNGMLYFLNSSTYQVMYISETSNIYSVATSGNFQSTYFSYGTIIYKNKLYFCGSDYSGNYYRLFRVNGTAMEEPPLVPNSVDYFDRPVVFQDKLFYQCKVSNSTSTNLRIAVYEDVADSMSVLPLQNGIQPYEPVFVFTNQFMFFYGHSNWVTNIYYLNSSNYTLVENRSSQQLYDPGKYILLSNVLYFPAAISNSYNAAPKVFKIIFEK